MGWDSSLSHLTSCFSSFRPVASTGRHRRGAVVFWLKKVEGSQVESVNVFGNK